VGGFIPLGDASRRTQSFPFATTLIVALNVVVFAMELSFGDRFIFAWSAIPERITHGHGLLTLLTSMFMHASWMHIIGNMIYLWAFGREIENSMGSRRFLAFYLAGGIVASLSQILADPSSPIPGLGASGAIAAVMGAFLITFPRDRIRTFVFLFIFFRVTFVPAFLLIGFWFLMQVLNVGAVAHVRTGGVAYLAHVGGFLFGVLTAHFFASGRRMALQRGAY
jgi:membrane associated rhomboid family serine protease